MTYAEGYEPIAKDLQGCERVVLLLLKPGDSLFDALHFGHSFCSVSFLRAVADHGCCSQHEEDINGAIRSDQIRLDQVMLTCCKHESYLRF